MTAISILNPYAPQPATAFPADATFTATQTTLPVRSTASGRDAGLASDQSGHGAGNGTGTGGAQVATLLERGRLAKPEHATPKSIVEAQSQGDPATEFLARKAEERAEAAREAQLDFEMPNPLPTAPILKRNTD